jgi:hypothetical protein
MKKDSSEWPVIMRAKVKAPQKHLEHMGCSYQIFKVFIDFPSGFV